MTRWCREAVASLWHLLAPVGRVGVALGGGQRVASGVSGARVLLCAWSWAIGNPPRLCQAYDQKNIRRRVYDALNVLMAMNIISKEKKEIKWIGLPTNSAQECQSLEVPGCPPAVLGGPGSAGRLCAAPGGDPGLEADGPLGLRGFPRPEERKSGGGGTVLRRRSRPHAWQQLPPLAPGPYRAQGSCLW